MPLNDQPRYNKSMDFDGKLKRSEYFGTSYLLSTEDRRVIATGQGSFDTATMLMKASFQTNSMGQYSKLMLILQTSDGYFSPLALFGTSFLPFGAHNMNHKMDTCLHWKNDETVEHILDEFNGIHIVIKAKHDRIETARVQSEDKKQTIESVIIKGVHKKLASSDYRAIKVAAHATYGTRFTHDSVDNDATMTKRLRFSVSQEGKRFTFRDLHITLRAFKSYWASNHDLVDCEVTRIMLDDIDLIISNNNLSAHAKNVAEYRAAISIYDDLKLENFAKLLHFYFNPDASKELSSSSKVGLAFGRLVGRRYGDRENLLDYEVIDLVFALQSIAESVAEKEVKKQNRIGKKDTLTGIDKVMDAIMSLEPDLPDNVRQFYMKDKDAIYAAIARPPFTRALEIAAKKLGVDLTNYKDVLDDIEKARRQVVHSEGYDSQFLINLLTKGTVKEEKSDDGKTISTAYGIKKGSLDHLYDLVHLMLEKYIEKYDL